MLYFVPIHSPCHHIRSYRIPCACAHYTVLFLTSSFITRTCVVITYRGSKAAYHDWDTTRVRAVKERASKQEGVDVDDADFVHKGTKLDDDHPWWQTGVFDDRNRQFSEIYMYRR